MYVCIIQAGAMCEDTERHEVFALIEHGFLNILSYFQVQLYHFECRASSTVTVEQKAQQLYRS